MSASIAQRLTMPGDSDSDKAGVFIRIRPMNSRELKYKSRGNEKHLAEYDQHSVTIGGRKVSPSTKVFEYPRLVLGKYCEYDWIVENWKFNCSLRNTLRRANRI